MMLIDLQVQSIKDSERGRDESLNKQGQTVCYIAAAIVGILLITVMIVITTMMFTNEYSLL